MGLLDLTVLLGGLAIFLYGMGLARESLQLAAGGRLRTIIASVTENRLLGLSLGVVVTTLLQSSSATTVMLVNFTSTGLMSLGQALAVALGAGIGTTVTVQIISFKVSTWALLMVAAGFFWMFTARRRQTRYLGQLLLAFGFIFFAMDLMGQATAPLQESEPFQAALSYTSQYPLAGLLAAALFTAIVQASAATIGLIISLSLGGSMTLDAEASRRVIGKLSEELSLGLLETAEGVLTIINSNMANAISSRTIQKGIDPRGFALVAMGGAGPLHGAEVAAMLGIPEVIVPPHPGITSAMGLLTTDLKYDAIRTQFQVSTTVDMDRLNRDCAEMEASLAEQFRADRVPEAQTGFSRTADLRYVGQGYELSVPLPSGILTGSNLAEVWEAFHTAHTAEYGHAFRESPIEIVNLRVTGTGQMPRIPTGRAAPGGSLEAALVRTAPCVFRSAAGTLSTHDTPFYRRTSLPVDVDFTGPAIILQTDSTTVVPPGATARVHESGSILISIGGQP